MTTGSDTVSPAPRAFGSGGGPARALGTLWQVLQSSMLRYVVRRVIWGVVLLFVVSAITFIIFYVFPSADPAVLRAGRNPNPAAVATIRHNLGLDKPFYTQFGLYMKGLILHFDLGYSYYSQASVRTQIFQRLPVTFSVAIGAFVLWMLIGIPVGIISAIKPRSIFDRLTMSGSLVAYSAPVYFLGLVALFLFASDIGRLHVFPGWGSYTPFHTDPFKWFKALIMPWCVLAAAFAAFYARMVRAQVRETMGEDFIRTGRAKGLSERRVIFRHGLRAALTPIVTMAGIDLSTLFGGAILTETVFGIPGIGRYAYTAITQADFPIIQGTVLFGAFFIIAANIVVDIIYAFLDPRVKY
ncbi:MAG: ABC transporter permease [Gaiellaceae bacterium]